MTSLLTRDPEPVILCYMNDNGTSTNPTTAYVAAREGRAVRVETKDGRSICARLARFGNGVLFLDCMDGADHSDTLPVHLSNVRELWVRG